METLKGKAGVQCMGRIVGYCRVSTLQQDLSAQREDIELYAERESHVVLRIYEEKVSGKTAERDEYQRMLKEIDILQPELVVVTEIDRLGRDDVELFRVARELWRRKVSLFVIKDGLAIDANREEEERDEEEELLFKFRALIAAHGRRKIRRRMSRGLKRKVAQEHWVKAYRTLTVFAFGMAGIKAKADKMREVQLTLGRPSIARKLTKRKVKEIRELRAAGVSKAAIGRWLEYRVLDNDGNVVKKKLGKKSIYGVLEHLSIK